MSENEDEQGRAVPHEGSTTYTRLSVNINQETAEALRDLAARRDISVTEVVRRCVSVYKFVVDHVDEGMVLQLLDTGDDTVQTLVLL